ncbi:MAG: hypothetical protein O7C67_07155 [Gammaproteobacteria bacterium]|nr:hypothetical protein [Gammaproteobacteria bacterium]
MLEEHLGLASGLVECKSCEATYLLELIDLAGNDRAYRVTAVEPVHAHAMVHTLSRGTCDIQRAASEVQNLESRSTLLNVTISMHGSIIIGLDRVADTVEIPRDHWRTLPCDGRWLSQTPS